MAASVVGGLHQADNNYYCRNKTRKRGALIILEGGDKCGKSTQCKLLTKELSNIGVPVKSFHFPDRSTHIGATINDYLCKKIELPDKAVHLLFSANRWELEPQMRKLLLEGFTLIVDRYSHSGIAFSAAKPGMNLKWCQRSDWGLPKPDLVLYLDVFSDIASKRGDYGVERYENTGFQKKVAQNFLKLRDDTWRIIDANKNVSVLTEELMQHITEVIKKSEYLPIDDLGID